MTKVERELEAQESDIRSVLVKRQLQSEREIEDGERLLKNVKGAFRLEREKVNGDQERLIKEIQIVLKNDDMEWKQIKINVRYRL